MYGDELRKQRVAIIQGLQKGEKRVLRQQIQNHNLIAISKDEQSVKVLKAQDLR